jgi:hypothetical protein
MNNTHSGYWPTLLGAILGSFVTATAGAAQLQANWLEVHLLDKQDGRPLADAAVCLGTRARLDQFGAKRSDSQGVVRFEDIRPHSLVVTASGRGYQGRQQLLEPLYQSHVLVIKLTTGGGGPVCDAPLGASAESAASLTVDAVRVRTDINAQAPDSVLVSARVSGPANQIRISEQADFKGAGWLSYEPSVPFTLSAGKGVKQLYIQVRRVSEVQGASIEVVSPVKTIQYRVN